MEDDTEELGSLNLSRIPGASSVSLDDSMDNISVLDVSQNIVKPFNSYSAWVKSFNLTYQSSKKHKNVLIEGDDLHFKLRCLENHERESRDYSGPLPNYVVANIGFVITL